MGYTYTPKYYSSLQDSITSICKSILPFSFNKPRLAASEQKLSKQQTDNLKWQQNSYHKILNLMGLHKEGIIYESEVSAFRTHLLETLIASKAVQTEQPIILRDKLIFLQELLHAKCISADEYHTSKRPLLQRLAAQGAEIEAKDVIVGTHKDENLEEEWSVIDLRDEQSLINKENSNSKNKSKYGTSAIKHIKEAATAFGFGKHREEKSIFDLTDVSKDEDVEFGENLDRKSDPKSILFMSETLGANSDNSGNDKGKKKEKSARNQWGINGFKKWKRSSNMDDEKETVPLQECRQQVSSHGSVGECPDTKTKLLSDGSHSSVYFIDKVLGDNIKKELSRIQTELSHTNSNFQFSKDQMDVISTKLPVDKGDLKQFFPKSWCDRYGDVVLDVVKKEFKDHVGDMENTRNITLERRQNSFKRWTAFEDDENSHPNQKFHKNQQGFFTS